jgi:hypothetical protein
VESIPGDIRVFDLVAYFSRLSGAKGKALRESLTNIVVEDLLKQRFISGVGALECWNVGLTWQ